MWHCRAKCGGRPSHHAGGGSTEAGRSASVTAGFRHRCREKRRSPRRGASPSMESKGERQDGLADVGVNRVPPGFARPGRVSDTSLLDRAAPANPVDDRRWQTGRGLAGPLDGPTLVPVPCRPISGFDAKRRLSGEAAIERPTSSSAVAVKRHRRCKPAAVSPGARGAEPAEGGRNPVDAHIRGTSCRSPFDPIEGDAPGEGTFPFPAAVPESLSPPRRTSRRPGATRPSLI